MSQPNFRILLSAILGIASGAVLAQGIEPIERLDLTKQSAPSVYQGQMVISVQITTVQQLDAALELAESSWTERPGIGQVILQIRADQLAKLTKLGTNPVIQIPDLHAHTKAQWDQLIIKERNDIANKSGAHRSHGQIQRGSSTHDESWFTGYKQITDIYAYMDTQIASHPDLISKAVIGGSIQSRDIIAYTISAPDAPGNPASSRPVIIWNGCQHAREWVSPMTVTYIASRLLEDAQSDPEVQFLLDSVRFVIIPVSNPDGYIYSWSTERYWRKNRRNNTGSSFFGVDLNRNWNVAFGGDGTSSDPSSDIYHGTSAFSEPETTAISNLALSYGSDLAAHIDYHTFSQLILWPLGYETGLVTPEPDRTMFINLSGTMSSLIQSVSGEFYDPIQSWELYAAAGTCSDWFYDGAGVPSFTIELRPSNGGLDGFSPPASIILPTAQENWQAAKLFARLTTQSMTLAHDPVQTVQAGAPSPVYLTASPGISQVDPTTATLHTRIGTSGSFSPVPMIESGSSVFVGDLPAAPCDQNIEYYFTADALNGASVSLPSDGASDPLGALAQQITVSFDDTMETDMGWIVGHPSDTANTGVWERADPQSTDAQPENDHTPGSGTLCWITDADAGGSLGANDIDGGSTTLTSPALDTLVHGQNAEVVYWRWYSNDQGGSPNQDSMLVEISDDNGDSWSLLESVNENAGQWVERRFPAPDSSEVVVRFIASDLGSGSIVEAGVDDLRIESLGCTGNPADLNGDGDLNFLDVSRFLVLFGNQDPLADFNADGLWNFLDVSAFLDVFAGG